MKVEFLGIYLGDCYSISAGCNGVPIGQWEGWSDFIDFIPSKEFLRAYPELQNKKYSTFSIYAGNVDYMPPHNTTMDITFHAVFGNEITDDEFDIKKFIGDNK